MEPFNEDLMTRQKISRVKLLIFYDERIYEELAQANRYRKAILDDQSYHEQISEKLRQERKISQPYKPNPALERMLLQVNESLARLGEKKASIEAAPLLDEESELVIAQKMMKNKLQERKTE